MSTRQSEDETAEHLTARSRRLLNVPLFDRMIEEKRFAEAASLGAKILAVLDPKRFEGDQGIALHLVLSQAYLLAVSHDARQVIRPDDVIDAIEGAAAHG